MGEPHFQVPFTVTIPAGGTDSDLIDLGMFTLAGIVFPATMTSTTMTFKVDPDNTGTFYQLVDETGAAISVTVSQGKAFGFDSSAMELAPFRWVKLVAGSAEAALRTIAIVLKRA